MLAHALDLLLGGKPRAGIVRPGASEAYVEGSFELPDALRAELGERIADDAEELVLARRVSAEGRTRAYLNGRSATAAELRDAGGALLSFYGQHEHRKLTLAASQLEILDGFCGPEQAARREGFAAVYGRERALRDELERLRERAGARDRELDLLDWELGEIDAAAPSEAEEEELAAERARLRNLEGLRLAAAGGIEAIAPESGDGAASALAGAAGALDAIRGVDAALDALADRAGALALEADDLAGELRRYGEAVDAPPGRLDEVEERLALFDKLKRKHGGTIAAVLAHGEACRARRDELAGAEEALEEAHAALETVRAELAERAAGLRAARELAAAGLAGAVVDVLEELAMEGASFEARLAPREDYGPSGGDEVEFLIAPEPGRARRAAARDGLRRRALARDAGADERRGRGRSAHAGLRRGRRGHRGPDRACGRRAAARPGRGPPGHLHHPPAPDRIDGRPPLHDREGHLRRPGPRDGDAAGARRRRGRAGPDARRRRRGRGRPAAREGAAQGGVMACGAVGRRGRARRTASLNEGTKGIAPRARGATRQRCAGVRRAVACGVDGEMRRQRCARVRLAVACGVDARNAVPERQLMLRTRP